MERLKKYFTPKRIFAYAMMIAAFIAVALFAPSEGMGYWDYSELVEAGNAPETYYGIWVLIVPAIMFVFCIITHGFLEAFIWATALTVFMRFRGDFFVGFAGEQINTCIDYDNARMILLYLLIGSVLAAVSKAGGALAFADVIKAKAKSSKLALVIMWIMDVCLSIDDEMSAFTTGTAITPLNDSYGVPREKSALMIRLTAVAPANLWPLGAWVVFVSVLLEQSGFAKSGQGIVEYMKMVPFMFFPIVALLVAILYAIGIVPDVGKVKKAVQRVKEGGPLAPVVEKALDDEAEDDEVTPNTDLLPGVKKPKMVNFFVPIIVLVGVSFLNEYDILVGIFACLVVCFIMFCAEGLCTPQEYIDEVLLGGMHDMLMLTVLFGVGVNLSNQLSAMGFADYVISITAGFLSPALLPFIVFVVFACTEFLCSLNWTLYMMALPVLVPLIDVVGANGYLVVAALICAGAWGSMGCMYSDGAMVAAAATKCDVYEASACALPYTIFCAVVTAILFLVSGFMFS